MRYHVGAESKTCCSSPGECLKGSKNFHVLKKKGGLIKGKPEKNKSVGGLEKRGSWGNCHTNTCGGGMRNSIKTAAIVKGRD